MLKGLREKYQNMALPVKASIWFVVCGVLKDVIDVLMTPIFTRILTTEQYGIYNVYNSWFQIAKIIFTLYLFSDVFNVGLVKFEKDRDRFISSTLGFVTALVALYLVIYVILQNVINRIVGLPWYLVLLLFAHVLVYVPYYCWLRRERYDYHYRRVAFVSLLYVILQPVTAVISIVLLDIPINPGHTRIIASVGVQIIIGVLLYVSMIHRGRTFYSRKYWEYSLKTGIELVPYNLSKVVLNQSDRIMINYFAGAADTAIYSVAHSAAFILQVVTEALDGAFVPWLYRKLKTKKLVGIKGTINGLLLVVAGGALGIELIAPEIMRILGSEAYYQGVNCIPSLVYSVYLIFLYTLFTNVELFYGQNVYVTTASSIGMVSNILLNAVFIPQYGFVAAGYTTMASYLVICLGHYILLRKCLKKEGITLNSLVDTWFLIILSLVLLIPTMLAEYIYQWKVLRWSIVGLLVILIAITGKKWLRLLKGMKEVSDYGQ